MSDEELKESEDPSDGYFYRGPETINGVHGRVHMRKWIDKETGKWVEKVIEFISDEEVRRRETVTPPKEAKEKQQKLDNDVAKTFLETGFTKPLNKHEQPDEDAFDDRLFEEPS